MEKKGQMFLIAALIIVGVALSLGTVYNIISSPPSETVVYDLSKEINFEGGQVVERGIFKEDINVDSQIMQLLEIYASLHRDSDLLIVYGDRSKITYLYVEHTLKGVVGIEGGPQNQIPLINVIKGNPVIDSGKVTITIEGVDYIFEIKEGQNFYIVLRKLRGEEYFVSRS